MTRHFSPLTLSTLGIVLTLSASTLAQTSSEGWNRISEGQHKEARVSFTAGLAKNPSDLEARRGLALLSILEGDTKATVTHLLPIYEKSPDSWAAIACWQDLVVATTAQGDTASLIRAAKAVTASPKAAIALKASAWQALSGEYTSLGKTIEAAQADKALGYLLQWRIIGPFDNVSKSGFDKPFAPETQKIALDQTVTGKDGLKLPWRTLARTDRDGSVDLGDVLGNRREEVFYALTAVRSEKAQTVTLRYEISGALQIWANGVPVMRDPIYRATQNYVADPFAIKINLKAGWNTLCFKVAQEGRGSSATILARITDGTDTSERGLGLPCDPTQASGLVLEPMTEATPAVPPALERAIATRHADDTESLIWRSLQTDKTNDNEAALLLLDKVLARSPKCAWALWRKSICLSDAGQEEASRAARTAALARQPLLAGARFDQYTEKESGMNPSERLRELKSLATLFPKNSDIVWQMVAAYDAAELNNDAIQAAKKAVLMEPSVEGNIALIQWYNHYNRLTEAEKTLKDTAIRFPNQPGLLESQIESLIRRKRITEAIALQERVCQRRSGSATPYVALGKLYLGQKNYAAAQKAYATARSLRPQDDKICALLADAKREGGDKAGAIALYKEAIALNPANTSLRDKLQIVQGLRPVVEMVPGVLGAPLIKARPKVGANPSGSAGQSSVGQSMVYLLDEVRQVVYPDGARVAHFHTICTVLDKAGVAYYQNFNLQAFSGESQPTIEVATITKADGKTVDQLSAAERWSVAFPSLEPGDTIEVVYRVEDYPRGTLVGQFWDNWQFNKRQGLVQQSRYVLITPPEMAIQVKTYGEGIKSTEKKMGMWQVREWTGSNLTAGTPEAFAPPEEDTAVRLDVSTVSSWKTIVDWYRDLSGPRCVPDSVLKKKAEELTKNSTSQEEKIRVIAQYAQQIPYQSGTFRMSAYIPTEGKEVLREGYGDCKDKAALIVAMLKHVGISAKMALLTTRDDGVTAPLPSPRFNHAIAVVDTEKGPLWIDGTADGIGYGLLPPGDQGIPALVIGDDVTNLTTTPILPSITSALRDVHEIMLSPEGNATGKMSLTSEGILAWYTRNSVKRIPQPQMEQALQAIPRQIVPTAEVIKANIEHLNDLDTPLTFRFDYNIPNFAQSAGDLLIVSFPWNRPDAVVQSLRDGKERRNDIEFNSARGRLSTEVRITLPAGFTVSDLPKDIKTETPYGTASFTYQQQDNVIIGKRVLDYSAVRVKASEREAFTDFLAGILKNNKTPLLLKKK
jgi:cellulose synthase operon protein C